MYSPIFPAWHRQYRRLSRLWKKIMARVPGADGPRFEAGYVMFEGGPCDGEMMRWITLYEEAEPIKRMASFGLKVGRGAYILTGDVLQWRQDPWL